MPVSRILAVLVLAHCGAPREAPPAAPAATAPSPPAPDEGTDDSASEDRFGPCGERWIADPDDPRVGVYVFERYVGDEDRGSAFMNLLTYDGESVILRWLSSRIRGDDCTYSPLYQVPFGPLRMRAQITPEGELFSLQPCYGWVLAGRFIGEGRIETTYGAEPPYRLKRLSREELEGPLGAELVAGGLFECRDIWEAPGWPIPPLPE